MILDSKSTPVRCGIVAAVLFGLFLLAEGALHFILSANRLREGIAKATGLSVRFEDCSVGLLGGVAFDGLTATSGNGDSLSARWVIVRPNLWACLQGRLQFEEVRVRNVRAVRMEGTPKFPEGASPAVAESQQGAPEGERQGRTVPRGVLKAVGMAKRVVVSNAAVDWMKANGSVRVQVEGADLWYAETAPGEGVGGLSAQRGTWEELLVLEGVHAKLALKGEDLALQEFTAQCGGGRLEGDGTLGFGEQSRFAIKLAGARVDLGKMSQELPSLRVAGVADGQVRMEGIVKQPQSWAGSGELSVTNGMFKGLGVLQMLGQIFQIQELANLKARRAHSKLHIADRKVSLEDLEIDASEIQINAPGSVDFKRALALQASVSLPEKMIRGRALQLLDKRLSAPDANGRRSVSFEVTGTLDKPQTDLLEKLVGDDLGTVVGGALGGVVEQIFGGLLKARKAAKTETPEDKDGSAVPKSQ